GLIWTITATPLSVLGRNLPAGGERGDRQSEAREHGGHDAVATAALEREDVFQQRAELPAQGVAPQAPGAQEADLGGGLRNAQRSRGLLDAEPFHRAQDENAAVGFGQAVDRSFDQAPQLAAHGERFRRFRQGAAALFDQRLDFLIRGAGGRTTALSFQRLVDD